MAGEVTICNLALAHLGDTATVVSIKPPDKSIQAQLCARFYYPALNALLEMASWGFATKHLQLAEINLPTVTDANGNVLPGTWAYGYAVPANMVNAIAVIPPDAPDDYEARLWPNSDSCWNEIPVGREPAPGALKYTPQPFALETLQDGTQVLLTNVAAAVLRYTTLVDDTTKFSPLFMMALSYLLASMLAGPLIKGEAGSSKAVSMLTIFNSFKGQATSSDANQRKTKIEPVVSWIAGR